MSDYIYASYGSYLRSYPGKAAPRCGDLFYVVPRMRLIAQDKTNSCWLASAQMVINWRRGWMSKPGDPLKDPLSIERWKKLYDGDSVIQNEDLLDFARDLGLVAIPPMSPTVAGLRGWLQRYGPLFVNGVRHITVIAGIREWMGDIEVLVYDPFRPENTSGNWRSLALWYATDSWSGRDTAPEVRTVFLYAP